MIRFVKGILHPGELGSIIIETNSGLGLQVNIPSNSPLYKNLEGEEVKVHTYMLVKEDAMNLYGFVDKESLSLFKLLITVNGVGPKAGLSIMGVAPINQLKMAIAGGDVKTISAANGVGKKTAERVILELKDKVGDFEGTTAEINDVFNIASDGKSEAVAALMALGYSKNEAAAAIGHVKEENLSSEEYIKKALKNLM